MVRDLKSSNGTKVNGEKVSEHVLEDGDKVGIGHTEMIFRYSKGSAPAKKKGALEETAIWSLVELGIGPLERESWLRTYLETILKRFKSERGFIASYNPMGGAILPLAAVSMDMAMMETSEGEPAMSRTIVEQAVKERRFIVSTNAEVDPRFKEATSVGKFDIQTVLCAPSRWQGMCTGAIYIERGIQGRDFSEEEGQNLQDFADLLGIALKAFEGHMVTNREEWDRTFLGRVFSDMRVAKLLGAGGSEAVKTGIREVSILSFRIGKVANILMEPNEEVWKVFSQVVAHIDEIAVKHEGELLGNGIYAFGGLEGESTECHIEAIKAAMEAQKLARGILKKLLKDHKLNITLGAGLATGQALMGWFGSIRRPDFTGFGEVFQTSGGLAAHAQDGEVLIDQHCYNKIHVFANTHRVPPVTITGLDGQIQTYRVVPF
jgi:adenylate cyclase